VIIPIVAVNRDKAIWGEDADEFRQVLLGPFFWAIYSPNLCRPERWESIPEASSAIPGVWGNMLTFLGGPRACIGFRFSLIESVYLLNYFVELTKKFLCFFQNESIVIHPGARL
jgi:cytochrome P450